MTDTKNKAEDWQTACCYEGEISHCFKYRKIANIDFGSWFLVTKVLFWILWVSEYFIRSARELKQRKGILAQPSQKKGKAMAQETIDLVHAFYEDDEYSRPFPRKKII